MLPIVGGGGGVFSFVHVDNAASAAVVALVRKAKRELGWAPRHPTWRDGFVTG